MLVITVKQFWHNAHHDAPNNPQRSYRQSKLRSPVKELLSQHPTKLVYICFLEVLAYDSRRQRESVGGWRKDEVQWMRSSGWGPVDEVQWMRSRGWGPVMSLELWQQEGHLATKSGTNYPSWNVLSLHSSSVTAVPSPVWEGHGGMVWRGCVETESQQTHSFWRSGSRDCIGIDEITKKVQ